jgi:hypothetical protein
MQVVAILTTYYYGATHYLATYANVSTTATVYSLLNTISLFARTLIRLMTGL